MKVAGATTERDRHLQFYSIGSCFSIGHPSRECTDSQEIEKDWLLESVCNTVVTRNIVAEFEYISFCVFDEQEHGWCSRLCYAY